MASEDAGNENAIDRWLALRGSDEEIYEKLGVHGHTRRTYFNDDDRVFQCDHIHIQSQLEVRPFDVRPPNLPFLRKDVQDFHDMLGTETLKGCWVIPWATKDAKLIGRPYRDDFRSLFSFRTIEFMIRPVTYLKNDGTEPPKVRIGWRNVRQCLVAALYSNHGTQMAVTVGRGQMEDQPRGNHRHVQDLIVDFEWRVDRALNVKVEEKVDKWRYSVFGGAKIYHHIKKGYDQDESLREEFDTAAQEALAAATVPDPHQLPFTPSTQPQGPQNDPGAYESGPRKRGWQPSESLEPGPSNKRQSFGSQSQTLPPIPAWRETAPYSESPQSSGPPSVAGFHAGDTELMSPGMQSVRSSQFSEPLPAPSLGSSASEGPGRPPGGFLDTREDIEPPQRPAFQMMSSRAGFPWPSAMATAEHEFGSPGSSGVWSPSRTFGMPNLSLTSPSQSQRTPPPPQNYGDDIYKSYEAREQILSTRQPVLRPQPLDELGRGHGLLHTQQQYPLGFTQAPGDRISGPPHQATYRHNIPPPAMTPDDARANDIFAEALRDSMDEEQQSFQDDQFPMQGPPGPTFPRGGHQAGPQGQYRGGGGYGHY